MEKFHFDGIRMDAISNAIYWQGDSSKGINEGALDFIKCMNSGLQKLHPSVMLIAEDSTNFPKVTAPVEYDGMMRWYTERQPFCRKCGASMT